MLFGINAVSSNQFVNESNVKQVNMAPKKHDLNSCEHDREKKRQQQQRITHIFVVTNKSTNSKLQSSVDERNSRSLNSKCSGHCAFDHTYTEHAERLKFT